MPICAWGTCTRAVSWRNVYCYRHWKRIPPEQRTREVAKAFACRHEQEHDLPPATEPEE